MRTETETGTRRSRQTERNMNARSWEAMQTVNKIEMESVVLRACVCVCVFVCVIGEGAVHSRKSVRIC